MESHAIATPFGRRSMTLALVASQAMAKERPPEAAAHKWNVFRAICAAKDRLGLAERSLAVLDALLSFHPETVLTGNNLVVFPSNEQLALRAHGMPSSTLRKHLALLVDAGVVLRRDSPNGKRYARKGRGGEIAQAFGFDLSPLVARAGEFESLAEEVRAQERALRYAKERITLARRDIVKMVAVGIEERVPVIPTGRGVASWEDLHNLYRGTIARLPRTPTLAQLEPIAAELTALAQEILSLLESHVKNKKASANESPIERHKQNSNSKNLIDFEPASQARQGERDEPYSDASLPPQPVVSQPSNERSHAPGPKFEAYPLRMVLEACPDLADYTKNGISSWRDFEAAAAVVRAMLGISPSAWEEARAQMGDIPAAIVVACILQKGATIVSAGGYLRELTRKAARAEFSIGPMVMALIATRRPKRKSA